MRIDNVISAAILFAAVLAAPAGAQTLAKIGGPSELPPETFQQNQFVDSAGCVFVRAVVGGQTTWVPRVSSSRQPVCGQRPTFAAAPAAEAPAKAPDAAPAEAATAVATEAAAAAPPAAATAPTLRPGRRQATPARPEPTRLVRSGPHPAADTHCTAQIDTAQRYLLSDGRRVTQCSEAPVPAPVAYLNALGAPGLSVAEGAASPSAVRRAAAADAGAYRVVWSKSVPRAAAQAAPATPVAAGAGIFVQAGVFADPANATRAKARLKALGLRIATAAGHLRGAPVSAVLSGPYATQEDAGAALAELRANGFPDAFLR